ncbi:ABC transporter permease [Enterocloster sp. OA13]|uniref:ABC transporter permease n=1 Tax=Enterocloster sp. OA13 TaxID=2914161 RepID=UPI00046ED96D|nr:ABC transporter permease [Enterocloster sp. OA13]
MRSWNRKRRKRFDLFSAITIGTALLVILFIGSAISAVMVSGLPCFAETIRSEEILSAFRLSVVTASISTVIVMALALPTAYALTRTDMPFKRLSGLMIELTLSLPYILLGLSLLIIFSSPAGKWLKEQGFKVVFSPAGIVMAHILVNLPYAVRLIRTAFEASDQRLEFIAQTLGASPWKCFLTILLPLCRGSLTSAFILTWSRALGEFGATLMLVGVTRFKTETLPGSIYLSISTGNNSTAMATAMLMLMISGCTLALAQVLGKSPYGRERQVGH